LVNRWLLAGELAQMIEGSKDKYEEGSRMTEGEVNWREERIKRDSSASHPYFLMLSAKSIFTSNPSGVRSPLCRLNMGVEKYSLYR